MLNKKMMIDIRQTEVNAGSDHLNVEPMRKKFSHLLNNVPSLSTENS